MAGHGVDWQVDPNPLLERPVLDLYAHNGFKWMQRPGLLWSTPRGGTHYNNVFGFPSVTSRHIGPNNDFFTLLILSTREVLINT